MEIPNARDVILNYTANDSTAQLRGRLSELASIDGAAHSSEPGLRQSMGSVYAERSIAFLGLVLKLGSGLVLTRRVGTLSEPIHPSSSNLLTASSTSPESQTYQGHIDLDMLRIPGLVHDSLEAMQILDQIPQQTSLEQPEIAIVRLAWEATRLKKVDGDNQTILHNIARQMLILYGTEKERLSKFMQITPHTDNTLTIHVRSQTARGGPYGHRLRVPTWGTYFLIDIFTMK